MATAKKLPSGKYRVRVYIGKDASGKNIYKSFTKDTKKEAEFAAAEYLLLNKTEESTSKREMTLKKAAELYIESRRNVLSPWTINGYSLIAKRDLGDLANVKIEKIDDDVMQRFVNAFAKNHSPKSVRNVYGFILSVIKKQIPRTVFSVTLPAKTKPKFYIPTDDEVKRSLEYTKGTDMWFAIAFCAMLGLRRGEICALTWDDVKGGKVDINKAMATDESRAQVVKAPKTFAGYRILDLPPAIQKELDKKRTPETKGTDRIISMSVHAVTSRWEHVCKDLGFRCRFYDLRHYNASTMLAIGIPDLYAMERMGHSTPHMLKNVYQHIQDAKRMETNKLITDKMNLLGEDAEE